MSDAEERKPYTRWDLIREAQQLQELSSHRFHTFPGSIDTAFGTVWYLDCLKCGRSIMLLPNADHVTGSAADTDWCVLSEKIQEDKDEKAQGAGEEG
jgi:hypothetical protein